MTRRDFLDLLVDVLGMSDGIARQIYHQEVAPLGPEGREEIWDHCVSIWMTQ